MSNILDITNPTAPSAVYTTATTLLSNIVPGQAHSTKVKTTSDASKVEFRVYTKYSQPRIFISICIRYSS
jgi:hypothetical protein